MRTAKTARRAFCSFCSDPAGAYGGNFGAIKPGTVPTFSRQPSPYQKARATLAILTTGGAVGKVANMKAELITRFRDIAEDGSGVEMVVWRVPDPVPPSEHRFKYRLVYLEAGRRMVGFDNERGKGDHKHVGDQEQPYTFVDVERLIDDFILEVEQWKSGP